MDEAERERKGSTKQRGSWKSGDKERNCLEGKVGERERGRDKERKREADREREKEKEKARDKQEGLWIKGSA